MNFWRRSRRSCRESVSALPADVQEALNTPEDKRTPEQKKLADDYAPIIRIDPPKYKEIMTPEQIRIYEGLRAPLLALAEPAEPETFGQSVKMNNWRSRKVLFSTQENLTGLRMRSAACFISGRWI